MVKHMYDLNNVGILKKEYETFNGIAGRVRYFIRATVTRNMKTTIIK